MRCVQVPCRVCRGSRPILALWQQLTLASHTHVRRQSVSKQLERALRKHSLSPEQQQQQQQRRDNSSARDDPFAQMQFRAQDSAAVDAAIISETNKEWTELQVS